MSNLEEKREKYFEKLSTNIVYVNSFVNEDNFISRKISKMLLLPDGERGLEVADKVLSVFSDIEYFAVASVEDSTTPIPLEENEAAKWLISTSKELLKRVNHTNLFDLEVFIADTLDSLADGKRLANLAYQLLSGMQDLDEFKKYVMSHISEKGQQDVALAKLVVGAFAIKTLLSESELLKRKYTSDVTLKDLKIAEDFAEEFRALCDKNIHREKGREDLDPELVKLFRETVAAQSKK